MKEMILTVRVPGRLSDKLRERARTDGTTVSELARRTLEEHLNVAAISDQIDGLDIPRRFRELYAQARCSIMGMDALARQILPAEKYNAWVDQVRERLAEEANKKEKEGVKK